MKLLNHSYNSVTTAMKLSHTREVDNTIYRKKRNDLNIYLTKKGAYRAFLECHGDKNSLSMATAEHIQMY